MKLDRTQQVLGAIILIALAYFAAHTLHKGKKPPQTESSPPPEAPAPMTSPSGKTEDPLATFGDNSGPGGNVGGIHAGRDAVTGDNNTIYNYQGSATADELLAVVDPDGRIRLRAELDARYSEGWQFFDYTGSELKIPPEPQNHLLGGYVVDWNNARFTDLKNGYVEFKFPDVWPRKGVLTKRDLVVTFAKEVGTTADSHEGDLTLRAEILFVLGTRVVGVIGVIKTNVETAAASAAEGDAFLETFTQRTSEFHARYNAGQAGTIWDDAEPEFKQSRTRASFSELLAKASETTGKYLTPAPGHTLARREPKGAEGRFATFDYTIIGDYEKGKFVENFLFRETPGGPKLLAWSLNNFEDPRVVQNRMIGAIVDELHRLYNDANWQELWKRTHPAVQKSDGFERFKSEFSKIRERLGRVASREPTLRFSIRPPQFLDVDFTTQFANGRGVESLSFSAIEPQQGWIRWQMTESPSEINPGSLSSETSNK